MDGTPFDSNIELIFTSPLLIPFVDNNDDDADDADDDVDGVTAAASADAAAEAARAEVAAADGVCPALINEALAIGVGIGEEISILYDGVDINGNGVGGNDDGVDSVESPISRPSCITSSGRVTEEDDDDDTDEDEVVVPVLSDPSRTRLLALLWLLELIWEKSSGGDVAAKGDDTADGGPDDGADDDNDDVDTDASTNDANCGGGVLVLPISVGPTGR
jgi:hypothetical protein